MEREREISLSRGPGVPRARPRGPLCSCPTCRQSRRPRRRDSSHLLARPAIVDAHHVVASKYPAVLHARRFARAGDGTPEYCNSVSLHRHDGMKIDRAAASGRSSPPYAGSSWPCPPQPSQGRMWKRAKPTTNRPITTICTKLKVRGMMSCLPGVRSTRSTDLQSLESFVPLVHHQNRQKGLNGGVGRR